MPGAVFVDVREREEWDEGHIPGAVFVPRGNLESRIEGAVVRPLHADRHLLRVRRALGLRRQVAGRARLRERLLARRRLRRLEAERLRDRAAAHPLPREARALLAPSADSGDRRGRPAEAARLEDPPHRRRRPRLTRLALPRGGRRRAHRDRRRGHRRRVEPPAPDRPLAEHARHAEGRQREADDRGAQSRRRGDDLPRAALLGEHRPDPRRRLGDHRRRHRQLPDALPRQRRVGLARDPGRLRLDLPVRRPGKRVQAVRGAVLPLPLRRAAAGGARAVVRRGRRPRRAAGDHRDASDERGAQARAQASASR